MDPDQIDGLMHVLRDSVGYGNADPYESIERSELLDEIRQLQRERSSSLFTDQHEQLRRQRQRDVEEYYYNRRNPGETVLNIDKIVETLNSFSKRIEYLERIAEKEGIVFDETV